MTIKTIENKKEFIKELKTWTNGTTSRYNLTQYQQQKNLIIGYDKKGNEIIITLV